MIKIFIFGCDFFGEGRRGEEGEEMLGVIGGGGGAEVKEVGGGILEETVVDDVGEGRRREDLKKIRVRKKKKSAPWNNLTIIYLYSKNLFVLILHKCLPFTINNCFRSKNLIIFQSYTQ